VTEPRDPALPIRVLICDDVAELRQLLRDLLADDPRMDVVGEAGNGRDCVVLAGQLRPDVVLLDLSMPDMDGLEVIPRLAKVSPDAGIVVFSGFVADRIGELALSLGADRYVEKGTALDMLANAVREVAEVRRNGVDGAGGRGGGHGGRPRRGDSVVRWLRRWWPAALPS
jgi:DNA-binding NarL/FixJ family response regulator